MMQGRTIQISAWGLAWICTGLVLAVLYIVGLDAPLTSYDEPVYAEFIRATQSGEPGLSYRGIFTWQRPPTSIWMYAAVSALVPDELGMRLLPALLTLLSAFFAGRFVVRQFDCQAAGLFTAIFCAAIPSQLLYGRLVLSDPPFVLLTVLAAMATIAAQEKPRYFLWALAALGSTFAIKSMAGTVPTLALGPFLLLALWRHRRDAQLRLWRSISIFVATAGCYYAIGFAVGGQEFYDEHIRFILLDRAEGEIGDSGAIGIGGKAAYLEHLFYADGAAVSAVLAAGVLGCCALATVRKDATLAATGGSALLMLALLSLLGTRLAHYLLPFYPVAAIAAGAGLALLLRAIAARLGHAKRYLPAAACGTGLLFLALGVGREPFDGGALPSYPARELGQIAATHPPEPIYAYEWYAPQLTYYADRDWHFATRSERAVSSVHSSREFEQKGVAQLVPPWPETSFLLAGPAAVIRRDPSLQILEELGTSEDYALVRARGR